MISGDDDGRAMVLVMMIMTTIVVMMVVVVVMMTTRRVSGHDDDGEVMMRSCAGDADGGVQTASGCSAASKTKARDHLMIVTIHGHRPSRCDVRQAKWGLVIRQQHSLAGGCTAAAAAVSNSGE